MARKFIDMETGEIIDLERFRQTQLSFVRQSQPPRRSYRNRANRRARGRWAQTLISHLGPMALLAYLAWIVLAFTADYVTPNVMEVFPWNPPAHATSTTSKRLSASPCGTTSMPAVSQQP